MNGSRQSLIDEMVAHAREDLPNECCGMVGGVDGEATDGATGPTNAAASPLRYAIDAKEQFTPDAGDRRRRARSWSAIYHSHTKSAAYPSQTDVNRRPAGPTPST